MSQHTDGGEPTSSLSDAEKQVLVAYRMAKRKRLALTEATLLEQAELRAGGKVPEHASGIAALTRRGWLTVDERELALSDAAVRVAGELDREQSQAGFGEWMTKSERSAAYAEFCQRVHDTPFIQFNMVDREQLDTLLARLDLNQNHSVVDLGCGIGTQAEYLSDATGARVTGVDFARAAIRRALERTASKRERLDFLVGDLNALGSLEQRFDVAISFDTLYFVDDLDATVGAVMALLRPGGRFAAFYTETQRSSDPPSILEPRTTLLGAALSRQGASFEWIEFTDRERRLWARDLEVASELKQMFEAEGNHDLWHARCEEARFCLENYDAGLMRRYLYLAAG